MSIARRIRRTKKSKTLGKEKYRLRSETQIIWRREPWAARTATKSRKFTCRAHALRFATKLRSRDAEYGRALIHAQTRHVVVAPWKPFPLPGDES